MKQIQPSMCCVLMYSVAMDRRLSELFTLRRDRGARMGQLKAAQVHSKDRVRRKQPQAVAAELQVYHDRGFYIDSIDWRFSTEYG